MVMPRSRSMSIESRYCSRMSLGHRVGEFEDAVGEGRLAMVDVRNKLRDS